MEKACMERGARLWTFLLGIVFTQASLGAPVNPNWDCIKSSALPWRASDESTLREARALKRPMFVLVYLDTCHWCRQYETETLETKRALKRLRSDYLPVAVNSALQRDVAKRLGARAVPATLLLAPDGQVSRVRRCA
jgi:thiol:disulfide interchange protein